MIEDETNLLPEIIEGVQVDFRNAVMDNFNTARALANFSDLFTSINGFIAEKKPKMKQKLHTLRLFRQEFKVVADVLGIFDEDPAVFIKNFKERFLSDRQIDLAAVSARSEAKKNKDYETADKIRTELSEWKIMLMDTPQGVEWDVILD